MDIRWILILPALVWLAHLYCALRGRRYPVRSFWCAVGSAVAIFAGFWVSVKITGPVAAGGLGDLTADESRFIEAWFGAAALAAAFFPLEFIAGMAWWARRAVRQHAERSRKSEATSKN